MAWQEAQVRGVASFQIGAAPPVRASVPTTTFWADGALAWNESAGTTWHEAHPRGVGSVHDE